MVYEYLVFTENNVFEKVWKGRFLALFSVLVVVAGTDRGKHNTQGKGGIWQVQVYNRR